ncbi:MAG: type I methionyl aminopeptidase [Planctomycetaceae bacterium]|nr:type I methionyl aminopeptidase [Planctomycetaceae bacterium]
MRLSWLPMRSLTAVKRPKAPIYSEHERPRLRRAGQFNADLLDYLRPFVVPGITTWELDRIAFEFTVAHGHKPACLGYKGYPKTLCTSVNEIVCHGIPDRTVLKDGDIVNIDATTIVDGYHGDSSETFLVGECSTEAKRLATATLEAMFVGIRAAQPYVTVYEVGREITEYARRLGYGVVREYQGHGVGREFHTEPGIPHYPYRNGMKQVLLPGMCFTIEPMLNAGTWRTVKDVKKGWPVRTADRRLSAQFEHTVLLTEEGSEILTRTRFGPQEGHRF